MKRKGIRVCLYKEEGKGKWLKRDFESDMTSKNYDMTMCCE